jgi:hypothetical protein
MKTLIFVDPDFPEYEILVTLSSGGLQVEIHDQSAE